MQRVALVTGAGSGIGRAIAVRLSTSGFRLFLVGRRDIPLRETDALCGGGHVVRSADLRDGEEAARVIDSCVAELGRLDVLVNNAGWSPAATIPETTPEVARDVFALNAVAPCVSIARAWSHFARQHAVDGSRSVIVSISSMAVLDPFESLYAYAGAKAALHSFTLSASRQGAAMGLRAFAIAPGAVETDLLRTIVDVEHLPSARTLAAGTIAAIVMDCVEGRRDSDNGGVIWVPSP